MPLVPGLVNTGIVVTVSVVLGAVKYSQTELDLHSIISYNYYYNNRLFMVPHLVIIIIIIDYLWCPIS